MVVAACKRWRFLYIIVCVIGSIGMPLGFSACIYDAAIGKEMRKAILLIVLFSLIVLMTFVCGRRLLPSPLYRVVFLFGCMYYVFIAAGLFGHYYLETQGRFFPATQTDIFENYILNQQGFWFPKLYLYWCYIRAGLPFFFGLADYEQLTLINIAQFFIGKVIEISAIGTIAKGITRAIKPIERTTGKRDFDNDECRFSASKGG